MTATTVRNLTPFPKLAFESWGHGDEKWHTVVAKGTFRIVRDGAARGMPEQRPLTLASEYWGDPVRSSMRWDNDLAPYKPATDVHVVGHARAPGAGPLSRWAVAVRVGEVAKRAVVTGPRRWRRRAGVLWELEEPGVAYEVPLRYELAWGGEAKSGKKARVCERNPVGVGFRGGIAIGDEPWLPAPQFEELGRPVGAVDGELDPVGFGPCAPAWLPRRARAGTFDDAWMRERWPRVPDDFDFAFYNSAPPDLVAKGWLRGDEKVELEGFHHDGPVRTALPGFTPFLLLRLADGPMLPHPMRLDTVVVDVDADQLLLTWRAKVPLEPKVRVIEIRSLVPAEARRG